MVDARDRQRRELEQGLSELGLALSSDRQQQLLDYIALLSKWNKTHNLTAVRDPAHMIRRHLLDSLSIHEYVDASTLLDVGAGAGLPGIPLAVANSHLNVTLVDSVLKKTRFMLFAATELGLANVSVRHERVEKMKSEQGFEIIVARAFSSLEKLCSLTSHLLAPGGKVLAMTGRLPESVGEYPTGVSDETGVNHSATLSDFCVIKTDKLMVPGETAERNIVVLQKSVS